MHVLPPPSLNSNIASYLEDICCSGEASPLKNYVCIWMTSLLVVVRCDTTKLTC